MVDVTTAIVIQRPPAAVAAVAGDPGHATLWLVHITSVHWSVVEVNRERLVLRTDDGPFPLELTTTWEQHEDDPGATLVRLRTTGEPTGARRFLDGLISAATKRANARDLLELKQLVER